MATEVDNEEDEANNDGDTDEIKDSGLEDADSASAEVFSEKESTVCSTKFDDLYDGICWCNDADSEDFDDEGKEETNNDGLLIDSFIDSEISNEFEVFYEKKANINNIQKSFN